MKTTSSRSVVQDLLEPAGVRLDGERPWDIRVHDSDLFDRILSGGSLALGESYMDGWWDCEALDGFFDRILQSRLDQKVRRSPRTLWYCARAALTASPGRSRAYEIGKHHYDIGNDLFSAMLGRWMAYSCAYWKDAGSLDEAQEAKLELICRKLDLQPGMRLLDIGCGWGALAEYAARHYGVEVLGITVSAEQVDLARRLCDGLPVTIELKDYRDLEAVYDRVVSVGMFEHVGASHYRTFMRQVRRCLAPDGLFLLQTIGNNESVRSCDPWISKYIFPNSMLPSSRQIATAAEGIFVLEDWHSFGPDYDRTLMAWHRNFTDGWDGLEAAYDGRFFRMWHYYLMASAGGFRARRNELWQIVFSRNGLRQGYRSIR
ncbi:MAG: cyclopropane fatty acyl phospholipid synthase [Desulfobacterales bacterium]